MPRFRYAALDHRGKRIEGVVELEDQRAAVERIQGQGLLALRVEPDHPWAALRSLLGSDLGGGGRLSQNRLTDLTRELALLLRAGQSLDQALRFTIELSSDRTTQDVLGRVRDRVRNGSALATALAEEGASFPRLVIGLVRAGEQSGSLGETLAHLAALLERQRAVTAKVRSAMVYPALLTVAAIGTIGLMIFYVLPQFAPLFSGSGAQMPDSLRILLGIGDALRDYGWAAAIVFSAILAAAAVALRSPGVRLAVDHRLLRLPLLGPLLRKREAARLTRTLGTLVQNGVALVGALTITRGVIGNQAVAQLVDRALTAVKQGAGLGHTLEAAGLLPARTVHLVRLGEETGQLATMALRAAEIQENELERAVDQAVALIVPVMTIVLGLIVGGIISAVLSAMLSLNTLAG